jgi:predicted amidohydrolase YtcJ
MSMDRRDLQVLLGHHGQLPVDVRAIPATTSLTDVIAMGLGSVGGDLPIDGSIGARTAAFTHPYEGSDERGELYLGDDELAEFFHAGHNAGLQVGIHAIGDRAIEQVLATWERVYLALDSRERRHFRARRHRVEHFELPSADQIERAAILGLAVSVQPAFDRVWGQGEGLYEERLGSARAMAANPIRTMLERGIEIGIGSDAPVTPLDPMLAIASLEQHHEPAQRLGRLEALKLHRKGSARLGHQEGKKGILEPGMHADFAAFDDDPLEVPSMEGLRPILTVSLGREVFRA